jgi:GNAT superfamily N-acetyltransferase
MNALRTDSTHPDFIDLVHSLDAYLARIDGEEHDYYHQYNKIDLLKNVIVIYDKDVAVGCGAIKAIDSERMEVKRMFTLPEYRGKGIASTVLSELENWAKALGYKYCVLETGKRMPDAIGLYQKAGYQIIENYGQYIGVENSVCFEKLI